MATTLQPGTRVKVGEGIEAGIIPATVLLLQAIHHANEHRTQVCTILGQLGRYKTYPYKK